MKKRVNILFQSDDNFAFMVGVAMSSLLEHAVKGVFYDIYSRRLFGAYLYLTPPPRKRVCIGTGEIRCKGDSR